ncbi:MAG: hypothetical protein MJ177_02160, partial [Clostridia bacterium]|nr:hypothetical protein [Clostridia bacterium]
MLYKKNVSESLSDELFKNPTSEYRGTPFWAWNCKLEINELKRQIEVFKEMGLGGFHMHVRTGLDTEYLSDEYMDIIKGCVEKAKNEKMLAWLYDEDRWPSGAAGGIVTKNHAYRQRSLVMSSEKKDAAKLVACYDVVLDGNAFLSSYRRIEENDAAQGDKWYAYLIISGDDTWYNGQAYADTLNKKAIEKFIEVTHEKYKNKVGGDFGEAVPAIFTDEPQFSRKRVFGNSTDKKDVSLPWTDDVPETFKAQYGYDILDSLPELFWEKPDGQVSVTRYHYHDHIAERFTESFAVTCGKWCGENGIALTGHMMEEPTLTSQTAALGEAMRSYKGFQLPGIDMLCARFEFTTAKQAQSAAHQYGREGVLSELYGVTGWEYDFRGYKLHGDWQAALGVTVRVPHLSWASMQGAAKRDYPASIHYQSPWYKKFGIVEDHFGRVNTAMTRGKPEIKVGVIHPVESFWLHWGPNDKTALMRSSMDKRFLDMTEWLLKGSIDFNFISESLLPELCENATAPLKVGKMEYDTIVVPGCETLRGTTLERLEKFRENGGRLIFMGDAPKYADAVPSDRGRKLFEKSVCISYDRAALLTELDSDRLVTLRYADGRLTDDLIYQLRADKTCKWLFVAHCAEPYNKDISDYSDINITVKGEYTPVLYNTLNGDISPVHFSYLNGNTVIDRRVYGYDSILLRLDPVKSESIPAYRQPEFENVIYIPDRVGYELSEPNVLLLDMAETKVNGGEWLPREELLRADNVWRKKAGLPRRCGSSVQPWVIEKEKEKDTLTLRFIIESDITVHGAMLAVEEPEKAKITFNGKAVASTVCGWYVDKSIKTVKLPDICMGYNELLIDIPFGPRSNTEWCYIIGEFGVRLKGSHAVICRKPKRISFSSPVNQDFPFYGGNITYHIDFESTG